MYTNKAMVYVGPYPCAILTHLCSYEVLTCETSPASAGTYAVNVSVEGQDSVSTLGFTYTSEYTPTLKAVSPSAGPPGTQVFLFGDATWSLQYRDCVEATWGEVGCVGSIVFGDYLCRQNSGDSNTAISFGDWLGAQRYGFSPYRVGCDMPAPDTSNTQPAIGTAGNLNATLRFEASMRGGAPAVLLSSYKYDINGRPYHFQQYADVTGISPGSGSTAGGTLVKISGRGFPTLSLGLDDTANVSIAGVPCTVVNSTYDTVFCVTGPKPLVAPPEATPIRGQYPGMRGVEYEFYNTSSGTLTGIAQLWRLNRTVLVSDTTGAGSYKTILRDAWEGPDYAVPYHCTRMKAFFVAPRAGSYRFYMQADDFGQLNGTWLQDGVEVSRMLINMTSWTYLDNYFQYAFQASVPIFLAANQRILLESAHCNSGQTGTQQLAVRMPVPEPRANSIAEVQTVTVASSILPRQLHIKYLYGAGANTTAYFVNITSLDDSKLDSPLLGLQLVFNDGAVSVVLPLTATSAAMDDMVEAAFGGQLAQAASNDLFGIRKMRTQGMLALQLGITSAVGQALGLDRAPLARLVLISNNTSASATASATTNCTVAWPGAYVAAPPPASPPPSPAPKLTAGMVVIVSPALPVPAVVPGGEFQLSLSNDSEEPLLLPYTTSAALMQEAVYNLTSLNTSVSISSMWREGTYYARVWTVTFPAAALNEVPEVVASRAASTPAGILLATEVRPANPPLTGSFKMSYGSYCESVSIGLTDNSATVRQKLGTLPGMTTPQKVEVGGSATSGYIFTVTFDPIGNPGDQPPLRVVDASGLTGVNPTVTVSTATDGSTDAFYAPIPTEFLQLAVSQPGTIAMSVNGAPSACTHPSGVCKFEYSTAVTPTITGVSPTTLSFSNKQSLPLTISGTLFDAGAVNVTVGTSNCEVTSVTAARIVCFIRDSAPAGIRTVNVNVAGLGDAVGATNITLETLYVTGTAPAPAVVPSAGASILNITGRGFDSPNCANNRVFIGSVRCSVLACDKASATVLYPGNGGAALAAATITAQVLEGGAIIDQDTPNSPTVTVAGNAPTILGITSATTMPAAGGTVAVSLAGTAPGDVAAVFLVPHIPNPADFPAASAAYSGRIACPQPSVAAASSGTGVSVSCTSPSVPTGRYHVLAVLSSGLQLLSTDTILFDLVITSVSPNAGSIGGGTVLTIQGYGFSQVPAENVVFITVPISATFPNGVIQCRTLNVTPSALTCVTSAHLASNGDTNNPSQQGLMPAASPPRPVTVLLCDSAYETATMLEYCASRVSTPRARIANSSSASCDYEYATALTPSIGTISPAKGAFGTLVSITGSYMSDVTVVEFLQANVVKGLGANVVAGSTGVSCSAPDLPSGVYTVRLEKASGEAAVDPYGNGVFTYTPTLLSLASNVGSLVGGRNLTLTVGGSGLADVISSGNTANVTVTVGGLPCRVVAVANRSSLTCTTTGMNGYVYAEYWNLGTSAFSMPDLTTFTNPVVARLEKGIASDWGSGSPLAGTIQTDFFAARYTFYLQTVQTDTVTFVIVANDAARLYVNDVLLGGQGPNLNTVMQPGIHKVVLTYADYTGAANVRLLLSYMLPNGSMSNLTAPEWQKVTPVPPGVPLPVRLTVNGVEADALCPASTVTLRLPYRSPVPHEPPSVSLPNATCAYVYTTQMTPTLVSLRPQGLGGVGPQSFWQTGNISVYGDFILDPSVPAASQVDISVANRTCVVLEVSPFVYNATFTTTRITCASPALPVGTWPVVVRVAGLGLTRPPANVATDLPTIIYLLRITTYYSPPNVPGPGQCHFSMFGGGSYSVFGWGLVKNSTEAALQRAYTPVWEPVTLCTAGPTLPPCLAAQAALGLRNDFPAMWLIPVWSDDFYATVRVTRIRVPNPEEYAGVIDSRSNVRYRPRVTYLYPNTPQFEQQSFADILYFCGGRTPLLSNISPPTVAPDAGAGGAAALSLTWALTAAGSNNDTLRATPVNSPSNATVEFEVGNTTVFCGSPVVTASQITPTTYTESIRCILPNYLPAANYTLWLCVLPFGCGYSAVYPVPLTVTSASPLVGSSAGGVVVTLTGNGFDTNVSRVAVRFGSSPCNVTSSTGSTLTCVTSGLDAKPAGPVSAPLFVTPTIGASDISFPSFSFTFDPSLESTVSTINPNRGSTEGGTPITITGANFVTGVPTTVTIGGTQCSSVAVVSDTTITCTTGKPPSNVQRVPLPVVVFQEGRGNGRSAMAYQYIDLWSRNSTWGGGPLPGYEDSVVIPEGVTVLMDVSPPKLFMLVLQGNLVFDDTQPYINLQAHYILVVGGNFTIGTPEKPYPGRANITMHGPPSSRDLPMYGAKALAVRQGVVTFFGQPKLPHYTTLNQTVDPGATSITINGLVNWQIGDRIVIASSSFYANEVHEATITAIDTARVPGCSVLSLDTPTKYVHLGEIHSQPGVATPLDMRAEVAVLTRNILLTGDCDSAKAMYGVQVMVNSPPNLPRALIRFDNIEVTQSGQAFRLGRYSIHWHMHGDVAFQSWVRGCSIHHTYNRALAVHGTHRTLVQNNLAFNVMGHAFSLEDGVESGNMIEGNIGIHNRATDALLNTDTTPAIFWITNPNNTVRHNRAAGSIGGYGFWYRLLDNPEGPSYTTAVCPKFTPLVEFSNNTAHSNMYYGLRIHPEYYPRNVPCNGFDVAPFAQQPAVFNGLVAYKNGMKGAVGTQLGLVQFVNFTVGDNGGGPKQHIVNGKDNGGSVEMSWIVDDRNRYDVALTEMAGLTNSTIYARTTTGRRGNAGAWPSGRRVTGLIAQSPVLGDPKHSALMSLINVTFVDFGPSTGFWALEHCGKCKTFQGGATTFTANISFVNADGSKPGLSFWSWGYQGIFLDTDGSMLSSKNLPSALLPNASAAGALGPGATWHSAVDSELFDPAECVYARDATTSNNGAICRPSLTFRRIIVNSHEPEVLGSRDLKVVSLLTNRTSLVRYSEDNEDGYQFTVATGRDYWVHWDTAGRVDPERFTLHKMDLMNSSHFVYISTKYVQPQDHFSVNDQPSNGTALPLALPTTPHGSSFYNRNPGPNSWWWGNRTYNDTKFTVFLAGRSDAPLSVAASACPVLGCGSVPADVVDTRSGVLYWSDDATWVSRPGGKPIAGDNVTIPYGWDLVIDESPPPLQLLVVQGAARFDPTRDVTLTATYILVVGRGSLRAGTPTSPHPAAVTIRLSGSRATPQYVVDGQLNLGSKVLTAIRGGTIDLFGREVGQRWIRLNAPAKAGDDSITVSDPNHRWQVGDKILITSTTFNVWQSEMRRIVAIRDSGSTLVLDSPLQHPHGALMKAYPGGPTVDMRAEVAMLSSNILITPDNGAASYVDGSEYFGARVVVSGNSTGRFSNIAMEYCGQAGLTDRACVFFDRLASVTPAVAGNASATASSNALVQNPSLLRRSALVWGMGSNVRVGGSPGVANAVSIAENVMYEALEAHSVEVLSTGNIIKGNLVLGTIKDMSGKSGFDIVMPSNFKIWSASNWVEGNVAAGSERYGYTYHGVPCSEPFLTGSFRNNSAHSCLAGMWLQASEDSAAEGCTALRNFTAYMNWDFGIITTRGLPTDLLMENVNVLDTKHSGVTVFHLSGFTEKGGFRWRGGLMAGQSSDDVCKACATLSDPGCHKKLSANSYNRAMPFTPAVGMQSAMFALGFTSGAESQPYDKPTGYAVVHGSFNISGVTVADFPGTAGCGGTGAAAYALANHPAAPDAFHPHYLSRMNVVNVATGPGQGMFYHTPPDPDWRNEADCGEAVYTREDGSEIPLNCAGPAHVYWRDLDGSLIAGGDASGVGTIAGVFTKPRVFPMDQGSPVLPGPCTYIPAYNSYRCGVNATSFLLDERFKPNPLPPGGIWGDPQHFVLESRDTDSEDRNFGPVVFNVSGSIDLVTAAMDHSACDSYACGKRLSTFWTYLPSFQTVYVTFTGTPSQSFRLWYPYADPSAELVLVFAMRDSINRRFVWLAPGNGPVSGRVPAESKPVTVGDGTGHGAFYWDQDTASLHVKITGGKSLELRTESAVMISQPFALTVDQFYAAAPLFLSNLASAMGIEQERMYIAKVVPGSSVVTTAIGPKWSSIGALAEPQLSAGTAAASDGGATPAPPPPSPSSSPAAASKALSTSEVLGILTTYQALVNDPGVAGVLGVTPLGPAVSDLSSLAAQDPLLAQEVAAAAELLGIATTTGGATGSGPTEAPTAAPTQAPTDGSTPVPTAAPTQAPAATPSPVVVTPGQPGSEPSTGNLPDRQDNPVPSPDVEAARQGGAKGLSSTQVGGMVAAVVGALVIGGVVAGAFVLRKRSRSYLASGDAPQPENSLYMPSVSRDVPGAVRSSHASTTSVHEGFALPNPAYETPSERRSRMSAGAAGGAGASISGVGVGDADADADGPAVSRPGSVTATPRGSGAATPQGGFARVSGVESLAAGASAPSNPQLIRPLVSTMKHPTNAPIAAPLGTLGRSPTQMRPPEVYHRGRVKVPAELKSDSKKRLHRNSAPSTSFRNLAERAGILSRAQAESEAEAAEAEADTHEAVGRRMSVPAQRMYSSVTELRDGRPGDAFASRRSDSTGGAEQATGLESPYLPRMPPKRLPALDRTATMSAPGTAPAAAPTPASDSGAAAAATDAASATAAEPADTARASANDETLVLPLPRTLETMESFIPRRPRTARPRTARTSPAGPGLILPGAGDIQEDEQEFGPNASPTALPDSPSLDQRLVLPTAASAPRNTMVQGPQLSPAGEMLAPPVSYTSDATQPYVPRPRTARPRSARPSAAGAGAVVTLAAGANGSGLHEAILPRLPAGEFRPMPPVSPRSSVTQEQQLAGAGETLVIPMERAGEAAEPYAFRPATARPRSARPSIAGPSVATAVMASLNDVDIQEVSLLAASASGLLSPPLEQRARSVTAAAAAPLSPVASALQPAAPSGETLVIPIERTLETMESFVPRPRTARPARPFTAAASGAAQAASAETAEDVEVGSGNSPTARPSSPSLEHQAPPAALPRVTRAAMMLPGGMLEFAATQSLVRSEVAAMLLSGGEAAAGSALEAAAAQGAGQSEQADSPQARSPAGLYSESMRKRFDSAEE